jgi:drug/metabolite transporter (DMT)-like permease
LKRKSSSAEAISTNPSSFGLTDLGMLGVVWIWAGNLTVSRAVFPYIPPLPFIALRFGIGVCLLYLILRWRGESLAADRSSRWRAIWVGLAGNTLYQWCFMFGLSLSSAANTALLIATTPLWIALIGTLRKTEQLSRRAWAGVALSFIGISLVVASGGIALEAGSLLGDALVIVSAICWAIYTIGAKPLLAQYSALKVTTMTMIGGTPLLLAVGLPGILAINLPIVPAAAWAGTLYASVLSLVFSYIVWYSSVQRVGSVRTSLYGNLVPVVGVLIAWAFGGEQISISQILGATAILTGMALTRS